MDKEEHLKQAKLIVNRITGFAPWSNWNGVQRSYIENRVADGLIEYGNRIYKRQLKNDIILMMIGFILGGLIVSGIYLFI